MSRKKNSFQNLNPNADNDGASIATDASKSSKSLWKSLGKFERLGIVCFGLLIASVVAGASGIGEKAVSLLTGAKTPPAAENNAPSATLNPPPVAMPGATQVSKEYIYAGSRLVAVEDANANAAPPAGLAIWRPLTGYWWVMGGQGSQQFSAGWGTNGDAPLPGDYDGDGKTDLCVFRPSNGTWYVFKSSDGNWFGASFGISTDIPVPADYDGDGKTDIAVYRPSNGTWYILRSSDAGVTYQSFGISTDTPAAADYDGDGKADVAVWRPGSPSTFYVLRSSNWQVQGANLGQTGDAPVPADYDGDGKADYAVRSGANWNFLYSSNNQTQTIQWEQATDKAVPNDYDGDGKVDIAVWRDSNGDWYIRKSGSGGALRQEHWGASGDIPVPAFYR